MKKSQTPVLLLLYLLCAPVFALELPPLFQDHAVLQQQQSISIWGWTEPNQKVNVRLHEAEAAAQADDEGFWSLTLPAMSAGGPYALTVDADERKVYNDIHIGEVWLISGQSNMEWKMDWGINRAEDEIADSNFPLIRYLDIPNTVSETPKAQLPSTQWQLASPSTSGQFSAIGWLFAKALHQKQGVAVGIIDSTWGGTPAQAWAEPNALRALPAYLDRVKSTYDTGVDWPQTFADNSANEAEKFQRLTSKDDALATGAYALDYDTSDWQATQLNGGPGFTDLAWLRREFHLDNAPAKNAVLELGELVQEAFVFVNGELVAEETWQTTGSRHTLPPTLLQPGRNVITLRVGNSWDNRPKAGLPGEVYLLVDGQRTELNDNWRYSNRVEAPLPPTERFEWRPGFCYNAMIAPLRDVSLRGVLWYQGESNVGEANAYAALFSTMIQSWGTQWQQPLPFYFVQLAGFLEQQHPQPDSQWALLRDQQHDVATNLTNAHMITAMDVGEEQDIHPRDKQTVAHRLWLSAQAHSYGEALRSEGPAVKKVKVKKGKVRLTLDAPKKALTLSDEGDEVKGFAIAGADGNYLPATARLRGNRIEIWHDMIDEPKYLLYAWADFPVVNLYGENSLPLLPFKLELAP